MGVAERPMSQFVIHNRADGSSFVQTEGDTILRAAQRAGIGLMYECNSGGCGSCKFEVLAGGGAASLQAVAAAAAARACACARAVEGVLVGLGKVIVRFLFLVE